MAKYYHVRISNKKNPTTDYNIFLNVINEKKEAPWDKDTYNKIKTGDYLGFIIGKTGEEVVDIYKVKSETIRENHWEQNCPYVSGNGTRSVKHRNGIILINEHTLPKKIEWKVIKENINFAPNNASWMPRGTQVVKNKKLLPFVF